MFKERHGDVGWDTLEQILKFVRDRGWADPTIEPGILWPPKSINPPGWDRIEELKNPKPSEPLGKSVTNNFGPISNSNIAVGDNNSQVQHNGLTIDQIAPLLDLIGQLKETNLDGAWEELEAELLEAGNDHQRANAVEKVRGKLIEIVTGTSSSLVAAGLLEVGSLLPF